MLSVAVILVRRPLITRYLTEFEKEYYDFHSQVREEAGRPPGSSFWRDPGIIEQTEPKPRSNESQDKNESDVRRKKDRFLYYFVNNNGWDFLQDKVDEQEALHQTAERILSRTGMSTWIVGRKPIAVSRLQNMFFLKAHLLKGSSEGKWLTREEMSQYNVTRYDDIQDIIS